jgi:hypothetical protein
MGDFFRKDVKKCAKEMMDHFFGAGCLLMAVQALLLSGQNPRLDDSQADHPGYTEQPGNGYGGCIDRDMQPVPAAHLV